MEKARAQRILGGNGTAFSEDQWRILRDVITAGQVGSAACCATDTGLFVETVTRNALSSWTLHAYPALEGASQESRETLEKVAQYEFAACAQRKLALAGLEAWAQEHDSSPVVFKGAANALAFYDKESLRPSGDIDVIMPEGSAVQSLQADTEHMADERSLEEKARHLAPIGAFGYPLEVHFCFIAPGKWGGYEDLVAESVPLEGFTRLRRPNAAAALTIALLHFAHHSGKSIFDMLDVARITRAEGFSLDDAIRLWKEEALVPCILPSLTQFDTVCPIIPSERWRELFNALPLHARLEVLVGLKLLSYRRFTKIREDWFWSRLMGPSLARRLLRRVASNREITQDVTGLHPKQPLFWFHHLARLPLRRLMGFWR